MVTAYHKTGLNQDNQLAMPDDIRQRLKLKAGDSVVWLIGDDGSVRIRRHYTVEELAGSLPPLNRHVDDDFGNIIREAMDEHADQVVARMNGEYDDE